MPKKSLNTLLKPRTSPEWEVWWRTMPLLGRSNNYRRWKNITRDSPKRKGIERLLGKKTKRRRTLLRFPELTWATSWLKTSQQPNLNWLLTDSFHITSRDSELTKFSRSTLLDNSKWLITNWLERMKILKNTSGQFKTLQTLNIISTTNLSFRKNNRRWWLLTVTNILLISKLKMLDGQTCTVISTHYQTLRRIWSRAPQTDQSTQMSTEQFDYDINRILKP